MIDKRPKSPDKKRFTQGVRQNPNNTSLKVVLFTALNQLPNYETVVNIDAEQDIFVHEGEKFNRVEVSCIDIQIYTVDKSGNERIYVPKLTHEGVEMLVMDKREMESE
jgi:hypothetical protein